MIEADYFLSSEAEKIPNSPGVYAFFYNPYSLSSLGMYYNEKSTTAQLKKAKEVLSRRINKMYQLIESDVAHIDIKMRNSANRIHSFFQTEGIQINKPKISDVIDSMNEADFKEFVTMGQSSCLFFKPLYCGMTNSQTLSERYKQHLKDFESETPSTFGGRISGLNLTWRDLIFKCIPVSQKRNIELNNRELERHMIDFSSPIFNAV